MGLSQSCEIKLKNKFQRGNRNLITDIPGVRVGQVTLQNAEKAIHTGVTVILPHGGNLFKEKVPAGVSIINGFGKSAGLIQVQELETIETPIVMTNTFGVGTALNALTKYMLEENEDIGVHTGTVNCLVTECNDGMLNDILGMHLKEEHVREAIQNADDTFEEGGVGAGTGMVCMGLKGGIGSASRVVPLDGNDYTIGAIVLSNFGVAGNLRIGGMQLSAPEQKAEKEERGSIIIVIGTNIPANGHQLARIAKRAAASLGRVGSYLGNGSGDIAIAFSNAHPIPHYSETKIISLQQLHDGALDLMFEATTEVVEEAIISSLYHAETTTGIRGKTVLSLKEVMR